MNTNTNIQLLYYNYNTNINTHFKELVQVHDESWIK